MAEEEQTESPQLQQAPSKAAKIKAVLAKPLFKWVLIIFLVLSLLSGISFATLQYLGVFDDIEIGSEVIENTNDSAPVAEQGGDGDGALMSYYPMEPKFVVNFMAHGRQRYLQLGLSLQVKDAMAIASIIKHEPLIKNSVVLLLANQDYAELQTDAGRVKLREVILKAIQRIMQQEAGSSVVEQVFFTDLVMQ